MATTRVSATTIEKKITAELAAKLAASGFRKKRPYLIVCDWGDGVAQVSCSAWKDRYSGVVKVTMMFGIRFEAVQALIGQPEDDPDIPTVAVPSHLLHEDHDYAPWNSEEQGLAMILLHEVETFGVPFFEKYSHIDQVLLALKSESPSRWFSLGPDNRLLWLIAILAVRGEKDAALALLDKEIDSRRDKPYGKRWRFDSLREKLAWASEAES